MKQLTLLTVMLAMFVDAPALTPVERAVIWTRCWETVRHHFVGFDDEDIAAWDADFDRNLRRLTAAPDDVEFWRELRLTIAALNDGRTFLRPPGGLPRIYDTIPVRVIYVDGTLVVKTLGKSPEVQASGIKPGDELVSVDGVPAMEYLREECMPHVSGSTEAGRRAEAVWRIFLGKADSDARLIFRRPNGKDYSIVLKRDSGANGEYLRRLRDSEGTFLKKFRDHVLYINVGQNFTANTEQAILDNLAGNPRTDYLVLDLRETKLGQVPLRVLEKFALFPLPFGAYREADFGTKSADGDSRNVTLTRTWRNYVASVVEPSADPYRGGIVLLVSAETSGPAEQFIEPLIFADRAVLIGDTTAGAGGHPLEVTFGGGASLFVNARMPIWERGYGNNRGVPPRLYVAPTALGLAAGKDEILDRALEFIHERAN